MMVQAKPSAMRRKRGVPEADIQREVVRFLRLVLPVGSVVHHSANEVTGDSTKAKNRQAILVGMGVHPGFADLVVISNRRVLFIEVKSRTGRLSASQEAFADLVMAQGFAWALVRSIDDAHAALRLHGFPCRNVRGL